MAWLDRAKARSLSAAAESPAYGHAHFPSPYWAKSDALRGVGDTLRCSVGLAPNRYVAKLASDMLKPDGLTVLLKRDLPRALYRLKLNDLIGIGPSMEKRIVSHGIDTVEQLCQLSPERMRSIWKSVLGERMWHWFRGADFNDDELKHKSLGKQHVLAPELRTRQQAYRVAQKLLQAAAANLRKENMWAGGIGVCVEFVRSRYGEADREPVAPWKEQLRICECSDTFTLQRHLSRPLRVLIRVSISMINEHRQCLANHLKSNDSPCIDRWKRTVRRLASPSMRNRLKARRCKLMGVLRSSFADMRSH